MAGGVGNGANGCAVKVAQRRGGQGGFGRAFGHQPPALHQGPAMCKTGGKLQVTQHRDHGKPVLCQMVDAGPGPIRRAGPWRGLSSKTVEIP